MIYTHAHTRVYIYIEIKEIDKPMISSAFSFSSQFIADFGALSMSPTTKASVFNGVNLAVAVSTFSLVLFAV